MLVSSDVERIGDTRFPSQTARNVDNNRTIILANNEGVCCGMFQAVSRERDQGGPSLVAGALMGGVHVGVSPVTSGFPCHLSTSSTESFIHIQPTPYKLSNWQRRSVKHFRY